MEAGLLAIVTAYHKGFGLSSKTKVIHRYLPREVGELVFYYLWLVQPFWEALRIVCGGQRVESIGVPVVATAGAGGQAATATTTATTTKEAAAG